MIYVIMNTKINNIIYVGHTAQKLDKRISAHICNVKYLQRHQSFKENRHKSVITPRLD